MADKDEDVIRRPDPSAVDAGSDDEGDELAQDFRLLNLYSNSASKHGASSSYPSTDPRSVTSSSALPKRGLKDFEPHPTLKQADQLTASREAMHIALSHERTHNPKTHVVGIYNRQTGKVIVQSPKGAIFQTLGRNLPGRKGEKGVGGAGQGGVELLPEEALWLVERGGLDLRWSEDECSELSEDVEEGDGSIDDKGMPMSFQAAYATLLGEEDERGGWLTAEKYQVYAYLKRSGFIVMRAEKRSPVEDETAHATVKSSTGQEHQESFSVFTTLYNLFIRPLTETRPETEVERLSRQRSGPLVTPGLYRSYDDIYRLLRLITSFDQSSKSGDDADHPFTTHFFVYNHSATGSFRKTAPPPPQFRICVVSARTTSLPSLMELTSLMDEQPLDTGHRTRPGEGTVNHMYQRLKRGRRNVIIAVVDEGMMNFIKFGDADFGSEELFKRTGGNRGGKRGGGGGRGRGGGRGGRGGRGGKG